MVRIYEKVNKTKTNPYGIKEIINENPLLLGPCIISILAVPYSIKDINGSLRQIADLVNPDIDNNYDNNCRIFGLGFGDYDERVDKFSSLYPYELELHLFLYKYFFPLFINNKEKIDTWKAMKNFRNITFLTYCNGAKVFKLIEDALINKMYEVGYSDTDIKMILSQICLASISGNVIKNQGTNTLALTFGDVNDKEFEYQENIKEGISKIEHGYIDYGSSLGYAISGDGNHDFKRHMTGDENISKYIECFLNLSIDNALENKDNKIINPITYEKVESAFNDLKISIKNTK